MIITSRHAPEGDITHLHIGLKGTTNALFLKELAEKTRRGLRGRIELAKAGDGVSFGYRIVRRFENGAFRTGERYPLTLRRR